MTEAAWAGAQALRPGLDVRRLEAYVAELERWNRSLRLVGPHDPEGIRIQVLDALLPFLRWPPPFPLLDIGSGAGLPGIPIAVAFPKGAVTCLEPKAKRVSFLRHAVRVLGLQNVEVVQGRAGAGGAVSPFGDSFAGATARAVAGVPALLGAAAPHLGAGGAVYLPRGAAGGEDVPSWTLERDERYEGPAGLGPRRLLVYRRTAA